MNTYFEQMILSASPVELIRILYQRAASSVRDAREHLRGGRIRERSGSINNAYEVLTELMAALRPAEAPELAGRLRAPTVIYRSGFSRRTSGRRTHHWRRRWSC
jgi:flagellin-specific chaperone FliS